MRGYLRIFLILIIFFTPLFSGVSFEREYRFNHGKLTLYSNRDKVKRPKIGLVLSGGGSRGIVHIGVIKALEKYNIPVDLIVGTSIGSVIGGLYASGYTPDEILRITKAINWSEIYQDKTQRTALFWGQKGEQDRYLLNLRFKNGNPYIPVAISPGQRIITTLADLILKARYQATNNFDNLRIPFRAVTTDLVSGRSVVLKKGNLAEAINASSAIPLLFVPVAVDSMLLVDGGLRSNLPVHVAKEEGMDIVIAVDVTSPLRTKDEINAPWEIVDQATTIMADLERQLEKKEADVLIAPDLGDRRNDDYTHLEQLVDIGYRATERKISQIRKLLKSKTPRRSRTYFVKSLAVNKEVMDYSTYASLQKIRNRNLTLDDISSFLEDLINGGTYQKVSAEMDTTSDSLEIDLHLTEFPLVEKIEIAGATKYPPDYIKELLFTRQGERLNRAVLEEDLKQITELYRTGGYSLTRIDSLVWDKLTNRLTIKINEGKITKLKITGNHKVKQYVIAREFARQEGQVFNWRNVQQAIRNAYATQLFERVTVDILENKGTYTLIVKVKEKSTVVMRSGGKYDTDRKAQLYLEFGDESMFGMGVKSMVVGRFGMRDGKLGIKIRDDRIFTTYLTFDLQAYYKWQINPITNPDGSKGAYREIRRGAHFQVGQQLKRLGQFIIELRHENIEDRVESGSFSYPQNIELRTFAIRAMADKRDRIDFPSKGINNYWSWESGNRFVLGSKESYTKALVNLEGYYSFKNRATWHLRMFFGIGDKSMPFSENFRLGGLQSFYGLHENEYFGRQLFVASAEYRLRLPFRPPMGTMLFRNFYVSFRYDFGGIWSNPNLVFSSEDFFSGVGGYIGVDTILGPLYFAYGRTTRGTSVGYISFGFNY
ncbi:MAG: BamA/TamA family outer membrane protein [Calditrichaeota bacterium]|nr:BamA/TamA family outer membrane protein [Calditrichota bacterium]